MPYCFARSAVKFQGRTPLKIVEFDLDWAFPDCNWSLNSPMATKWCSIEEVPYCIARSSVKFHGHTGGKNWRFESNLRLLGRSQLSNPSDLPCLRSSIKFQAHMGQKNCRFWPELRMSAQCLCSFMSSVQMHCMQIKHKYRCVFTRGTLITFITKPLV